MKNFLFGFLAAIILIVCFVFGAIFILSKEVEGELYGLWEDKQETELSLTIYPSVDIDLSDTLGLNADAMAEFLSQGSEDREGSYRAILNSGLPVEIVSYYQGDGPDRTQKVHFTEGKVGNRILETSMNIQLLRDEIPDATIQGSSQLLQAIEDLQASADLQRSSVDLLQKKSKTEQVDADDPSNLTDYPNHQLDE